MTENENMVVENVTPPEEQKEKKITWEKFAADLKERCRKFIVNLKRRPTNIAFFILIIGSLVFTIGYTNIAQMLYNQREGVGSTYIQWSALCSFVTFLCSILVLVLFMNSFPKRRKPKIVMLVLTYVFIAVMILTDSICLSEYYDLLGYASSLTGGYYTGSENIYIAHIVFLGLTAVVLACTPLIKMGLMKINTRKNVESTEFKGNIDLENVEE